MLLAASLVLATTLPQGLLAPVNGDTVSGPVAALLLQALPPAVADDLGTGTNPALLAKHFRALTLTTENGEAHLNISCSSATWQWVGNGRAGGYKLVSDEPTCTIATVGDADSETQYTPLAALLQQAAAANALKTPVLPAPTPIIIGCHTRLCE